MYKKRGKNFIYEGSNHPKIFFVTTLCNKKCLWLISQRREISHRHTVQSIQNEIEKFCQYFFRGSSNPLLCRKYLRNRNLVFHKIYAHKWLCTAVCGHNIFLVTIRWRRWRDSNSRNAFTFTWFPIMRPRPTRRHLQNKVNLNIFIKYRPTESFNKVYYITF